MAEEAQVPSGDALNPHEVERIEEAAKREHRRCDVDFSVFVGSLPDGRDTALELHRQLGASGDGTVLVAVDPGERVAEIVTGTTARRWVDDRACALATLSMVSSFSAGDLVGGICHGLTTLGDQARRPETLHLDQP